MWAKTNHVARSPSLTHGPSSVRQTTSCTTSRAFIFTLNMAGRIARRAMSSKVLTKHTINPNVLNAKYAVRGEIVLRSIEHAKALKSEDSGLPFESIVSCNIGNPQECGKNGNIPRQVMSLIDYPDLLQSPIARDVFPDDVVERAQRYVNNAPGGVGAYSHSKGVDIVRQEVATFLEDRDGFPADPEDIF